MPKVNLSLTDEAFALLQIQSNKSAHVSRLIVEDSQTPLDRTVNNIIHDKRLIELLAEMVIEEHLKHSPPNQHTDPNPTDKP